MKLFHALSAVALLAFTYAAQAHEYKVGTLVIGHPWARATPKGASVGGGYLTIKNTGKEADRLKGGTFSQSGRVEIHEMAVKDGVMSMRPLKDGLEIAAGSTVELKPGSYHVMFIDLKNPLNKGETVKGTLEFEKAGSVAVEFEVEAVGASAPAGGHDHGSMN